MNFFERVLELTAFEYCDEIWWRRGTSEIVDGKFVYVDDGLHIFVMCSDTFDWATADAHEITPDNIDSLEETIRECDEIFGRYSFYTLMLWVARQRMQKPITPLLKRAIEEDTRWGDLFEDAAVHKPVGEHCDECDA